MESRETFLDPTSVYLRLSSRRKTVLFQCYPFLLCPAHYLLSWRAGCILLFVFESRRAWQLASRRKTLLSSFMLRCSEQFALFFRRTWPQDAKTKTGWTKDLKDCCRSRKSGELSVRRCVNKVKGLLYCPNLEGAPPFHPHFDSAGGKTFQLFQIILLT